MGRKLDFLEKAVRLIPGYKGYKRKEERRDNDQLLRTTLTKRLEQARTRGREITGGLRGPAALKAVTDLDRVDKKLEKVIDEIRFAARGYRGLFDMHKVRENELDSLYRFDVELVENVSDVEKAMEELAAAAESGQDLAPHIKAVVELLIAFSEKMESRSELMIDLEKNTPAD
jgi:hypothetical protein